MCSNYRPVTQADRLLSFFGVVRPPSETPIDVYPQLLAPFIRRNRHSVEHRREVLDGRFGIVEGHEDHSRRRTRGHPDRGDDTPPARLDPQQVTIGDGQPLGVVGMYLGLGFGRNGLKAGRAARHRAAMPVKEDAAGREDEGIFCVRFLGRGLMGHRAEQPLAPRKGFAVQDGRTRMIGCGAGPL